MSVTVCSAIIYLRMWDCLHRLGFLTLIFQCLISKNLSLFATLKVLTFTHCEIYVASHYFLFGVAELHSQILPGIVWLSGVVPWTLHCNFEVNQLVFCGFWNTNFKTVPEAVIWHRDVVSRPTVGANDNDYGLAIAELLWHLVLLMISLIALTVCLCDYCNETNVDWFWLLTLWQQMALRINLLCKISTPDVFYLLCAFSAMSLFLGGVFCGIISHRFHAPWMLNLSTIGQIACYWPPCSNVDDGWRLAIKFRRTFLVEIFESVDSRYATNVCSLNVSTAKYTLMPNLQFA